mgnify:FL=1
MNSILIGKIVNIHGIKGEIKVYPYTDDIENLSKLKEIYLDEKLEKKYIIKSSQIQKNMLILKLDSIDSVEEAEKLRNMNLYIPKLEVKEEDTYYIEDLISLEVIDIKNNVSIGKITYVFNNGANDVYEILTNDGKKVYFPAIKQVVKQVDIKNNKIYVEVMKGLI